MHMLLVCRVWAIAPMFQGAGVCGAAGALTTLFGGEFLVWFLQFGWHKWAAPAPIMTPCCQRPVSVCALRDPLGCTPIFLCWLFAPRGRCGGGCRCGCGVWGHRVVCVVFLTCTPPPPTWFRSHALSTSPMHACATRPLTPSPRHIVRVLVRAMVRGQTVWWVIPLFWVPICCLTTWIGATQGGLGAQATAGLLIGGAVYWTLLEVRAGKCLWGRGG